MTPREKQLAWITGGLVALLAVWFLYGTIAEEFAARDAKIAAVRDDLDKQETTIRRGSRAARAIAQYETQSLPAEPSQARSLYQAWLWDWLQDEELAELNVTPVSDVMRGEVYRRLTFKATGRGDLRQLTQLLLAFYSSDQLHMLRQAIIKPVENSRDLRFTLTIDALALPGSENNEQLTKATSPRMRGVDREALVEAILTRNLFAPPNNPPRLAKLGTQRVELGDTLRLIAKASDADELDKVKYSLADAPPEATISSSGELQWKPAALGEFSATIIATDSGTPPRDDRQTIAIHVVEKPPEVAVTQESKRPTFDNAKHAYLTGTIQVGDRWQVWIELRTKGKLLKLQKGDRIDVGSVSGKIEKVTTDRAEIATDDNRRLTLVLGEPLSEATVSDPGKL